MATAKKPFDLSKLTLPLMGLVLVIAAGIFLFVKDDGFSGIDSLKLQSAEFWVWAVVFVAIAILAVVKLIKIKNDESVTPGLKKILLAVALVCIAAPFAKGCTDKANKGVTAPNYQPK